MSLKYEPEVIAKLPVCAFSTVDLWIFAIAGNKKTVYLRQQKDCLH